MLLILSIRSGGRALLPPGPLPLPLREHAWSAREGTGSFGEVYSERDSPVANGEQTDPPAADRCHHFFHAEHYSHCGSGVTFPRVTRTGTVPAEGSRDLKLGRTMESRLESA